MSLRITNKIKPGGLDGTERINFESRIGNTNKFKIFDTSFQEILDLSSGGANYTFINGLTESLGVVSLGGSLTGNTSLNLNNNTFTIIDAAKAIDFSANRITISNNTGGTDDIFLQAQSASISVNALRILLTQGSATLTFDTNEMNLSSLSFHSIINGSSYETYTSGSYIRINADSSIQLLHTSGSELNIGSGTVTISGAIHSIGLKSGVDQATAGAIAGELWVDTSASNVIKMGV